MSFSPLLVHLPINSATIHDVLSYERIAEDISKFEAMHNTIMGNTVVENAEISIVEVSQTVQIEPLAKSWD